MSADKSKNSNSGNSKIKNKVVAAKTKDVKKAAPKKPAAAKKGKKDAVAKPLPKAYVSQTAIPFKAANDVNSFTGRKRIRRSFGKITEVADMPNLIEVQRQS